MFQKKNANFEKQKSLSKIGCQDNINVHVRVTMTLKCSLNYKF